MEDKLIGLLGGMGPLATIRLFELIVNSTPAVKDQDHIRMLIYNNPKIPDRSEYILGRGPSPVPYLIESARLLDREGVDCIMIPCNTAHLFIKEIQESVNTRIINMIEETAEYAVLQGYRKVGLFSTLGTFRSRLYHAAFEEYGIELIEPSDEEKEAIHQIIYGEIKKNTSFDKRVVRSFEQIFLGMKNRPDVIIKGCTEISLLDFPFNSIDPLEVLAKTAVSRVERLIP